MDANRRQMLAASGALAAGLAGCSSLPFGGGIPYGSVSLPESEPPRFRQWVPSESAFEPHVDAEQSGRIRYKRPGVGNRSVGRPFRINDTALASDMEHVGIGYTEYDAVVHNGSAIVGLTSVDRESVASALDPTGYEHTDTHRGYDRYTRSDGPRALAVGDEAIVAARADGTEPLESAVGRVTTTIDAKAGRAERRHESDDDFRMLTEMTGGRPSVQTSLPLPGLGEPVGSALSYAFDEDNVYVVVDHVYASAADRPDESTIQDALADTLDGPALFLPSGPETVDIETDGRTLSVRMKTRAAPYLERVWADQPPLVTFGVEFDSDRLTFTHEAGESVPASRLGIRPEYGFEGGDPFEGGGTFGPGDSVTLDLTDDADESYAISWQSAGETHHSLFEYHLGAR
jgi:hypothetical protein